jgi:hypothetical protein
VVQELEWRRKWRVRKLEFYEKQKIEFGCRSELGQNSKTP